MSMPLDKRRFTYADYLQWPDDVRVELIDGVVYDMTPAPSPRHQEVVTQLVRHFGNFLDQKPCKVYAAPFDVRLSKVRKNEEILTVVQPDLVIVCDKSKIDDRGCVGAPDLVVEIVSPSTFRKDHTTKLHLYEQNGVPEYWIVYPAERAINVCRLADSGKYGEPEIYAENDRVPVGIFNGELSLALEEIFAE